MRNFSKTSELTVDNSPVWMRSESRSGRRWGWSASMNTTKEDTRCVFKIYCNGISKEVLCPWE